MKKQNKFIIISLIILLLLLSVFLFLNRDNIAEMQEMQKDAVFKVTVGEAENIVSMDDILKMSAYDKTVIQRSGTFGTGKYTYTGVLLSDILQELNIDIGRIDVLTVMGADGYTSAFSGKEIHNAEEVFICYYKDGRPLGTKLSGGSGPFQLINTDDVFAQRWVRFVSNIEVVYK